MATCSVVDLNVNCMSPANLDPPQHIRRICYACGEHVCTNCSVVTVWFDQKRAKVCFDCMASDGRGDEVAEHVNRTAYTPQDHALGELRRYYSHDVEPMSV